MQDCSWHARVRCTDRTSKMPCSGTGMLVTSSSICWCTLKTHWNTPCTRPVKAFCRPCESLVNTFGKPCNSFRAALAQLLESLVNISGLRLGLLRRHWRYPWFPLSPRSPALRCFPKLPRPPRSQQAFLRKGLVSGGPKIVETLCPSGQGDGLEIHWALPAGARIPSVSS